MREFLDTDSFVRKDDWEDPRRQTMSLRKAGAISLGVIFFIWAGMCLLAQMRMHEPSMSKVLVENEVKAMLSRGEQIEKSVPVFRRDAMKYFEPIAGMVATTNQGRVLYAGVLPRKWGGREDERNMFEERSWGVDSAFQIAVGKNWRGGRSLELMSSAGGEEWKVKEDDAEYLVGLWRSVEAKQQVAVLDAVEQETQARVINSKRRAKIDGWLAAKYREVKGGESLERIAKEEKVKVEDLAEWNGLEGNKIKKGQKLLVKPQGILPVGIDTTGMSAGGSEAELVKNSGKKSKTRH